ncbi:MAG: helix-turn-helix transcriptional regulator [Erysipelotrichaceae bacterium]|nr:helix-turn-helix transcriptional regulator [Erysipelotrichaceae bacterium]
MVKYTKLLNKLDELGYTSYKIRQEKLMGQKTYMDLKKGEKGFDLNLKTLDRIAKTLNCDPWDLVEFVDD